MNWDAVGAVAELAGALAVIVTLVYLAVQLRQNSTLLRASIATASRESTNQLTGLLATDREALRVFYAGLDGRDSLEELDRQHFDAMMSLYLEALLQSYQQDFTEGLERAYWMLRKQGFAEFWAEFSDLYGDEFSAQIEEMMQNPR
jgi:hypothetical protein